MSTTTISIDHNFETGHRLPILPGKCQNIHGHSWLVTITLVGEMNKNGYIVDYGTVKRYVRAWIDTFLDHGIMLGDQDPLLPAFLEAKSKVFLFGEHPEFSDEAQYTALPWPTVEGVAEMLAVKLQTELDTELGQSVSPTISRVRVRETAVNYAEWSL